MSTETIPARDRILATAGQLFYREGYRAVGIDRVIAEADVAKATVYKYFPTKDDLILAWLAQAEAGSVSLLPAEDDPEPFFAYADAMIAVAERPECLGCTFQSTAAEFADPAHPAHAAAQGAKERVLAILTAYARAQGLPNPDLVAMQVYLLIEGVWATVRMFRDPGLVTPAREAVRRLAGRADAPLTGPAP
jgi:AcrR family transcriptional regulator